MLRKEDLWAQYGVTQTLTIWLRLWDNSGGGDDCCRGHSLKEGQSRRGIAGSHKIVKRGGGQSTGRKRSCRSVREGKLFREAN